MSSKTLKAARMSQHMTQQALADATGISRVNITKAESGAINPENMTARNIIDLAEVLEVSPAYLIRADEPMQVSVDNGFHFLDPEEVIEYLADPDCPIDWETIAHYMDDRFRELVDWELAPCTELEFLTRYLEIAPYDLVIG